MARQVLSLLIALLISTISVVHAAELSSDQPINHIQIIRANDQSFAITAEREETTPVGKDNIRVEISKVGGRHILLVHCRNSVRIYAQNDKFEVFEIKEPYGGMKKIIHEIWLGTRHVAVIGGFTICAAAAWNKYGF